MQVHPYPTHPFSFGWKFLLILYAAIVSKFIPSTEETTASVSSFVNSNPLIPTADLPEDKSNYGKVTIAPPTGEETENRFINYGEIGREEEDEGQNFNLPESQPSIDVNSIKEKATDINKDEGGAVLDSLLNLGNPTSAVPSTNFITPAEKIVKTDPLDDMADKSSDYFETPNLSSIELSTVTENPMDNNLLNMHTSIDNPNLEPVNGTVDAKYTIEESVEKIRELVKELEKHGITATTDEMNFDKSYQIIIKIDKTQI